MEIKNADEFVVVELRDLDISYLSGRASITLEPEDTLEFDTDGTIRIVVAASGEKLVYRPPHMEYYSLRIRSFRRRANRPKTAPSQSSEI